LASNFLPGAKEKKTAQEPNLSEATVPVLFCYFIAEPIFSPAPKPSETRRKKPSSVCVDQHPLASARLSSRCPGFCRKPDKRRFRSRIFQSWELKPRKRTFYFLLFWVGFSKQKMTVSHFAELKPQVTLFAWGRTNRSMITFYYLLRPFEALTILWIDCLVRRFSLGQVPTLLFYPLRFGRLTRSSYSVFCHALPNRIRVVLLALFSSFCPAVHTNLAASASGATFPFAARLLFRDIPFENPPCPDCPFGLPFTTVSLVFRPLLSSVNREHRKKKGFLLRVFKFVERGLFYGPRREGSNSAFGSPTLPGWGNVTRSVFASLVF
jgi:hypothetical protein